MGWEPEGFLAFSARCLEHHPIRASFDGSGSANDVMEPNLQPYICMRCCWPNFNGDVFFPSGARASHSP